MIPFELTPHALTRLSQRGIKLADLDLVTYVGTEVEGGYIVLKKDVQRIKDAAKQMVQRAEKLEGKRVVVDKNKLITGYHADLADQRRLLRTGEQRNITE